MSRAKMPAAKHLGQWPAIDQAAWLRAAESDPLAPGGQGSSSHWRASTRRFAETGYGAWLAWLEAGGHLAEGQRPSERATIDRVRQYLAEMTEKGFADYTRVNRLQSLADVLRTMDPDGSIAFIGGAARTISRRARPKRDLSTRLRPAADVLELGSRLMARVRERPVPELKAAIAFRDGLLISLWACRMLRVANLSQIVVGQHLLQFDGGTRLSFSADDMKQKRPWECSWPERLEGALRDYLARYRPVLEAKGSAPSRALWLSQFGAEMPPASVAQIIKLRTAAEFGKPISSHLMRHIAATGLAEAYPDSSTDIALVLGHASTETSEKHYILGRGSAAVTAYSAFLEDLAYPARHALDVQGLGRRRDGLRPTDDLGMSGAPGRE